MGQFSLDYNRNNTLQNIADGQRYNGVMPQLETIGQMSPVNPLFNFGQPQSVNLMNQTAASLGTDVTQNSSMWQRLWDGLTGDKNPFGSVNEKTGQWTPSGLTVMGQMGMQGLGAWQGMKQLDLAKKQFGLQKDMMNKNYAAQRGLTNTRLRDRQNARNAADSNFYQDTGSYMKENEVK